MRWLDAERSHEIDPVLDCLAYLAREADRPSSPVLLRAGLAVADDGTLPFHQIEPALEQVGMRAEPVSRRLKNWPAAKCPAILELADERGVSGPHVVLARCFREAVAAAWGRPLTMNVSMPTAAVMLDLGFASSTVKAIPLLARTAGLLAHLAEEREQPVGFLMAARAEEAIRYRPPAEDGR